MTYPAVHSAQRVDSLDGLRAIAILLVLLQHFTPGHDSNDGLRSLPFKLADIGWTGVDLFFVISGFLITGILLRGKELQSPLSSFFARRLLRIAPAYYLALVVVLILLPAAGVLPAQPAAVQLPFFAYVSNFFWSGYDKWTEVGMSHFWSLALEMQFYFLWPLMVYKLHTRTLVAACVVALLTSTLARGVGAAMGIDATITFGWTPFRWDGLILGSLVAIAVHNRVEFARLRGFIWSTVLLAGAYAFYVVWFDHGGGMWMRDRSPANIFFTAAFPLAFSGLYAALLVMSLQEGRAARLFGARFLKPLARYSYGIYIIHFLCAPSFERLFGPAVLERWLVGRDLPIYVYLVAASGATFVLAALSFHLYEVRFLRIKPDFLGRSPDYLGQRT